MMNEKKYRQKKAPIYPVDIKKCRENLKIGQKVKIRILEWDLDLRQRTVYRMCTIEETHRWLFLAKDSRGRRYTVTYVDMMT